VPAAPPQARLPHRVKLDSPSRATDGAAGAADRIEALIGACVTA
jgi:hypothetical protein